MGTDIFGIQLIRVENMIHIYPRICFHDGACLDNAKRRDTVLRCPWHGREVPPFISYDIETKKIDYHPNNRGFSMNVSNDVIEVIIEPE